MKQIVSHLDPGSITIIVITLILFSVALFLKGLTHDLLLEAGVFLVSTKLIFITYKNAIIAESIHRKLDEMNETLKHLDNK